MTCTHARLLALFTTRGGSDLSAEDMAALTDHRANCPACAAAAAAERVEFAAVSAAMNAVDVPSGLGDRLQAAADLQLRAIRKKTLLRRAGQAGAVAAALFLGLAGYRAVTRPALDSQQLAEEMDDLWQSPDRTTINWLAANRLTDSVPDDFHWSLASYVGRRDVQGVAVPAVRLDATNRQVAWVLFVRGELSVSKLAEGQFTSNASVKVYRDLPGGVTVVVVYTGNDFRAFLRPPGIAG